MNPLRVYIAGCGGMLGQAFEKHFRAMSDLKCTDIDLNAPWLTFCDVRELEQYRGDVRAYAPDVLIHLPALTDLEVCERDPDNAYRTNTIGAENAALIANELNIPLIYISTAGIFDGQKDAYDDWDLPNPLGVYARSKYLGERFVVENCSRYLVCRAGWMMGGGPGKDKKFVRKLLQQLESGKTVFHIVNDKLGTPTYTHDFAANVELLLRQEVWGLYNLVCRGFTDRIGVAQAILRHVGVDAITSIVEVPSSFFDNIYFAPRPACERLIDRRLELRGLNRMREWQDALTEYLNNDYADLISRFHASQRG